MQVIEENITPPITTKEILAQDYEYIMKNGLTIL